MSEFKISCPNCAQHIACDESYYGVQINCPTCGALIQMPAGDTHAHGASAGPPPSSAAAPSGLRITRTEPPPSTGPSAPGRPGPGPIPQRMRKPSRTRGKSWLTTFLLAWFLGGLGVDRFYTGRIGLGIGKLLTNGLCGLWSLVDILLLLFKRYRDADGNYLQPVKRSHYIIALSVVAATILISVIVVASMAKNIASDVADFGEHAQGIDCMGQLTEVGLAFRLWAMDHDGQFPFNVPASNGGTLEACQRKEDGFDANAFRHFQALSNLLVDPAVLVCPGDFSRQPADDWESLNSSSVTYLLRSGPQLSDRNPDEVLVRCPIDGNTLYCDGQVKRGQRSSE